MTDDQFLTAVERGEIAPADFSHELHVRLAFLALQTLATPDATDLVRSRLQDFARRAGKPGIYDDRLTRDWIARIDARRQAGDTWERFRKREQQLFAK